MVDFVHDSGSLIGVQLAHAGRKSGSQPLWEGGAALPESELDADPEPWQRLGPSGVRAGLGWSTPEALDAKGIGEIVQSFVAATLRAEAAGFDAVELHFGHGYLVASFLLPISNRREDAWGGSLEGRMKLALDNRDASEGPMAGRQAAVLPALGCRRRCGWVEPG